MAGVNSTAFPTTTSPPSQTTFDPGFDTTTYGTTTLTGSTIPIQTACLTAPLNNTVANPSGDFDAVFLNPVNNQTLGYLANCCQGAPIVLYQDNCLAYCAAANDTMLNKTVSCLAPNGVILPGIGGFGVQEGSENPFTTTTSTTSTSTATGTTSATAKSPLPTNGAGIVKASKSTLVTMAVGAMVLSWVMNGLA